MVTIVAFSRISSSTSLYLVKTPTPLSTRWLGIEVWLTHAALFRGIRDWSGVHPTQLQPLRTFPAIALFLLRRLSWKSVNAG